MTLDPRNSLQLAFQHLEAFSVPDIGTFRRLRFSAVVDHQANSIHPPGERFVLEKGEGLVDRLQDFVFRFHDISIGSASELVSAISALLVNALNQDGSMKIVGVGELQKSPESGYVLISLQPTLALTHPLTLSHSYFGLQPIAFNLNQQGASQADAKADAAKRLAALHGAPVEAAPKPVRSSRKRSGFKGVMVFLLLLIMAASGAGIIWQDKFQGWMIDMGWIDPKKTFAAGDTLVAPDENSAVKNLPPDTVDAALSANNGKHSKPTNEDLEPNLVDPVAPADLNKANSVKKTVPVKKTTSPKVVPPKKAVTANATPPSLAEWGDLGVQAQNHVYYLVVGARRDAEGAREIAGKITKGGIKARVLVPRIEGPHYKVFVYQDRKKDKVIQKMVEWKTKFPEKSWIFWVGM